LDELVHRSGLPHRIITDLGSNYNNHRFWEYYKNSAIDVQYVSVAHPRANGQVERASATTMLQRTSCRSLALLALKYQRVSLSTSFTRHPSRSRRHRPLIQHIPRLARRS
jgi:hypothetical protein